MSLRAAHDAGGDAVADLNKGQVLAAVVPDAGHVAVRQPPRGRVVGVQEHALGTRLVAERGEVRELRVQEVRARGGDERERKAPADDRHRRSTAS